MAIVSEMIPPGSHIFPDAGNSCGWTTAYLELDPPTEMHAALNIGAMLLAFIALIALDPPAVLFAMFGTYALSGPVGWSWMKMRRRPREGAGPTGSD